MSKIYPILGSHVGMNQKGDYLIGSAKQAIEDNGNTFMIYTGPPQNSIRKDTKELKIEEMKELLKENNIDINDLVVHAPYIINIANSINEETWKFGVEFLLSEIKRCEAIGVKILVLHPGAFTKGTIDDSLNKIIEGLNKVFEYDCDVKIALETMSGKGTEVGISFDQLSFIINSIKNKNRIGICLDTCHMNDAGYDLNNWKEIKNEIEFKIGLDKVLVFHINDSKNVLNSHKDRHENIGYGTIGFDILNSIVWDEDFKQIPKILETPYIGDQSPYKSEIDDFRNKEFSNNFRNIKEVK